ncbi:hypothetical protein UAY_02165 [Enterococcus moraviensis ATCC BAA-383]|uniref:Uncharacterized protein n=1 Tax=Enterococcus moraviensis ATCC BAA-383 TaxID=1158609 RepID=R2T1H4_9ENTE|nr:hypothetical protein [Enterococcus moraviensis]EOH98896.1 hypothetical protein UAY_02165 [Enterococcus moraviensis ATCC BAA-383]EOT71929.1 hypothetical protein I586_01736 [Enterococcus moraviensis ATCC BAA-383]
MNETKENIKHDLDYYQPGIRQLYLKYYQKYLILLLAGMMLTVSGIGLSESFLRWLLVLLFLIEVGSVIYLLRYIRGEAFDVYFQQIKKQLPNEFQEIKSLDVQEDDQAYYFIGEQELFVKLKKKNTRNFPSKIRQYTLLVGSSDDVNKKMLEEPLQFFYYDITQIKYSSNYKKELLKNTDFIAKRNKRRLKSVLILILFLTVVGAVIYLGAKKYLNNETKAIFEGQVENEYKDTIDQKMQVSIKELAVTNENETITIQVPKYYSEEKGELISVDDIEGNSSKAFACDTFYVSIFMSKSTNAASLSEFMDQVLEDGEKGYRKEKIHPDLFKNEYVITTKTNQVDQLETSNYTTYFFETDKNYGWIICELEGPTKQAEFDLEQQVNEILQSVVLDTKQSVI